MSHDDRLCPKCNGAMEEGFIAEFARDYYEPSQWVEGPPEPKLFGGTKMGGRRRFPVRSFRCTACGYLEFFAGSEPPEALECLSCGAEVPADASACPACRWTWKEQGIE